MLRMIRSREADVTLTRLSELFEMERLVVAAKFHTYSAFSRWVQRIPDLTVVVVPVRGVATLVLDSPAALFVGAVTGERLSIDFAALRARHRCRPIGDFSYQQEVA
jgi:hypothetical protein